MRLSIYFYFNIKLWFCRKIKDIIWLRNFCVSKNFNCCIYQNWCSQHNIEMFPNVTLDTILSRLKTFIWFISIIKVNLYIICWWHSSIIIKLRTKLTCVQTFIVIFWYEFNWLTTIHFDEKDFWKEHNWFDLIDLPSDLVTDNVVEFSPNWGNTGAVHANAVPALIAAKHTVEKHQRWLIGWTFVKKRHILPPIAAINCINFEVCCAPSGIGSYNMGFVTPGPSLILLFFFYYINKLSRRERNLFLISFIEQLLSQQKSHSQETVTV